MHITINSAGSVTTTIYVATLYHFTFSILIWLELTQNGKVDSILSSLTKQIATFMKDTSTWHLIVSHVTAAHNLISDDETYRETI